MPAGDMIAVETPVLEGVQIPRHHLDPAARKLLRVATGLLDRAKLELDRLDARTPTTEEEAKLLDAHSKALTAIAKTADSADRIVRGLLAEQRERAKMAHGRPQLTDNEYARHMAALAVRAARNLSDEDFSRLVEERMERDR